MTTCLYHAGCIDGFTSAWLVHKALSTPDNPVELVAVNYGEPFPLVGTDEEVYIVDFSYPPAVIAEQCARSSSMIHLWDHHQTAIDQWRLPGEEDDEAEGESLRAIRALGHDETCPANLDLVLDLDRSGAGITFDMLYGEIVVKNRHGEVVMFQTPAQPPPNVEAVVKAVQDRDIWANKVHGSAEITDALRSLPQTIEEWDGAVAVGADALWVEGRGIGRFKHQMIEAVVKCARPMAICSSFAPGGEAWIIPMVECPYMLGSEAANQLLQLYPKAVFAGYYYTQADGTIQVGLRSDAEHEDVAKVAEAFGGGGHRNASGLRLPGPNDGECWPERHELLEEWK